MKKILFVLVAGLVVHQLSAQVNKLPAVPRKAGCASMVSGIMLQGIDTTKSRGMALNELMWDNGKTIAVKFLPGGSQAVRSKVMQFAKEWELYANLKFNFLPDNAPAANVRIKLGNRVHNSYIGIGVNEITSQFEQTMNLDTTDFVDYQYYIKELEARLARRDTVIKVWEPERFIRNVLGRSNLVWNLKAMRGTTLHEFGHTLGLLHEQSFPGAISWKRTDSVYNYYLDNNPNWTRETVDFNVFEVGDYFYTNGTNYDAKSIMHYSVAAWQTTNGYSLPSNYELSAGDKMLIAAMYPKSQKVSALMLPRVDVKSITKLEVIKNYNKKKGISIFPTLDLASNPKMAEVYLVARLIFEDSSKTYYVNTTNQQFHWGGFLAAYQKKMLLPATKVSYNKLKKDTEIFLPDTQIPEWLRKYKVKFEFFVAMVNPRTKEMEKIGYYMSPSFMSIAR
ncbi:MAG: hypothetical protein JNK14_20110 [Chitinophagaceae bacterium]|nr:hypothetical protein [Chitinophagaceae bacterium]